MTVLGLLDESLILILTDFDLWKLVQQLHECRTEYRSTVS